jgi:hypothetical protein
MVAANSTICTTMRAEKPPRAVRRIKEMKCEMKCGPSTPPLDPIAEGHGRQKERQDTGRGLYQGHRKPTSRIVECPQVLEGPEVPTQDAKGEHTNERSKSHRDPEPGA